MIWFTDKFWLYLVQHVRQLSYNCYKMSGLCFLTIFGSLKGTDVHTLTQTHTHTSKNYFITYIIAAVAITIIIVINIIIIAILMIIRRQLSLACFG